jgi:hypothetical protein
VQEWGFQANTPEYANCRMNLHQQSVASNVASQAYYQRQQEVGTGADESPTDVFLQRLDHRRDHKRHHGLPMNSRATPANVAGL